MSGDISWIFSENNHKYLSRHPEIERFNMPKTFYFRFLPDRLKIHWAIIVPNDSGYRPRVTVYFINDWGRAFDKLEFKNAIIARRRLRKCGFDYSTNKYCKYSPLEPIYIQLSEGKKSAPYSKGNLFQSVQRDGNFPNKARDSYEKGWATIEKNNKERKKERKSRVSAYMKQNNIVPDIQCPDFFCSLFGALFWAFIITLILTLLAGR